MRSIVTEQKLKVNEQNNIIINALFNIVINKPQLFSYCSFVLLITQCANNYVLSNKQISYCQYQWPVNISINTTA